MPMRTENSVVFLEGRCPPEEAEMLLDRLRSMPDPAVGLMECEDLHTAVLQVLLAVRPVIVSRPRDQFLADCLSAPIGARPLPPTRATPDVADDPRAEPR